uniref:Uncharacterized protein n=1 Tax=Anguilla anguilla TaxID=7936 RepID=A0A0E9VWN2_ANGAN
MCLHFFPASSCSEHTGGFVGSQEARKQPSL